MMSPDNQIGTRRARGVPGCARRGKGEGQAMNGLVTVLRAADAAARWHVNQRRKGAAQEPYVTHLLEDDVADLVVEVTDNKKLPKAERKQLQIKNAPKLTPRAKILKFADKISNLRSLAMPAPPHSKLREAFTRRPNAWPAR
jgi:(p)ppGpp synthase/HD superfamily hydrolase